MYCLAQQLTSQMLDSANFIECDCMGPDSRAKGRSKVGSHAKAIVRVEINRARSRQRRQDAILCQKMFVVLLSESFVMVNYSKCCFLHLTHSLHFFSLQYIHLAHARTQQPPSSSCRLSTSTRISRSAANWRVTWPRVVRRTWPRTIDTCRMRVATMGLIDVFQSKFQHSLS
jgi:hypothetical protein